jgi:hypothetical protein
LIAPPPGPLSVGEHILRECSEGGRYQRELQTQTDGHVSARGCLPCFFFAGDAAQPEPEPARVPVNQPGAEGMEAVADAVDDDGLPRTASDAERQLQLALALSTHDTGVPPAASAARVPSAAPRSTYCHPLSGRASESQRAPTEWIRWILYTSVAAGRVAA